MDSVRIARSPGGSYANEMTRILGINGSMRPRSSADRALQFAFKVLESAGAQCEGFEIGSLPLMDGRPEDQYPAAVLDRKQANMEIAVGPPITQVNCKGFGTPLLQASLIRRAEQHWA